MCWPPYTLLFQPLEHLCDVVLNIPASSARTIEMFDQLNSAKLLTSWGTVWEVNWCVSARIGRISPGMDLNYSMCKPKILRIKVLPQDTTHLIQRPCYQRGSPCQDPAGNWTTWRPDHRKETQTAVVRTCFPFIRSGQNHLARHSERWKKTRQTEEEVGRQHQGMDRPRVRQVPEGSGEQGKMEKTGCGIRPSRLRDRWWWWWWCVN